MQGSPSHPSEQEGQVTIRFLHIWEEHEEEMEKIVRAVEEKNEGLRVEINTVDWNSVSREVQSAAASGNMYDVFFQYADELGSAHSQGLVLDLTPYMDETWQSTFQPGALEAYSVDGGIYGIPFRSSGVVVIYNKNLFARNGWRAPSSQEEMTALMQLALNEGYVPLSAAGKPDGFQLEALRGIVTNYVSLEAGNLDDPDRLRGRRTDWQGELAVGAQRVKDWVLRGYFGPSPLSVDEETALDTFLSGQAPMLLCNTNDLYDLRSQDDYLEFDMGCFLFPGPESCDELLFSGASYQDGFAVYSGTAYPEQAVQLLRGLTDPATCASWAKETLSVMAVQNVEYEDEMLCAFNEFFQLAGKHTIRPDYALGDSQTQKSQLFVSYLTSDMTADDFETNYENIVRDAIRASEAR
ncbi:MAG: ABC transporter substrate-binding protein [Candidatus Spyradocola sp.]|jgi:raffinose/stachyose/melibiose transport system substrate-binding protein